MDVIKKKFYLILILPLFLLISCTPHKSYSEPSQMTNTLSSLAGCGAGIDRQITAKLEAEYKEILMSGNIGFNFENNIKAVFDAKGASEEKYKLYLECFQKIDERNRQTYLTQQCLNTCDQIDKSDFNKQTIKYEQCISKGQSSCLVQCAVNFGLSRSTCQRNCSINDINKATWEKNHSCERPVIGANSCKLDCLKS